jgi:hypothetical protein
MGPRRAAFEGAVQNRISGPRVACLTAVRLRVAVVDDVPNDTARDAVGECNKLGGGEVLHVESAVGGASGACSPHATRPKMYQKEPCSK